jgi:hypothetical protein
MSEIRQQEQHTHTHTHRGKERERENLHCVQWNITRGNRSNNIYNKSCHIDCQLKLDKFLNIRINRPTPSDNLNLQRTIKVVNSYASNINL